MKKKDSIFSVESPNESPGFLLWQVTHLWQRQINAVLETVDLTHMQFVLLASLKWLNAHQPSVTQVDIATHAKIDKMMTSNVLRTLQSKGLLMRTEHPTDTRAKVVTITQAGELLIAKAVKLVEDTDRRFFKDASQLNQLLVQLIETNAESA